MKETLGCSRIHRIRNDYKTALTAMDQGVPVSSIARGSVMVKDIHSLSKQMLMKHRGGSRTKKKGLLSNLFGLSD
ncbi:MAG: hypothetical protein B0D96_11515 [Candidatus Sedimenticola endophacoides]|uniref:Uncharacterized protein n=1 Tax=Candidatus Sedimenticola endophacoides TaxID=2548426 RepID=A0A657Q1F6_9GAMM|nr:MAG: hypothetical protein B0D96_11515 [Candidatus Sedimenticola endophacoides]OQX40147.1 MAG: hypothetical protein B0D89_08735 [Candidatus Sedimenticola endophacoides]OQX40542.1 MAG: hypothetical protein B0D88_08540 [Candidatus Sedimenticola endophacoides]OQX44760.1 MAG: hypothetical protein B0D85_06505 [Candidatus Sedimenticola endophacoides]OQX46403.1 MAG: hypothetical protein B0D86_01725 [Candidatus Sedimenticola endophacoides]